jgi:hypothetical protein
VPGGIFVSYRRDDSRHAAGRLLDRLRPTYGPRQLFMAADSIAPGRDFVKVLAGGGLQGDAGRYQTGLARCL